MTTATETGPLRIVHGDLYGPKGRICDGSGLFAVSYDPDPETPMLYKYGHIDRVFEETSRVNMEFARIDMPWRLKCLVLPVDAEIVDEINACIGCTGRIAGIITFLENLNLRRPELASRTLTSRIPD